jgi:cytochrome c oxidase assembly factor CtaG
MVTWAVFGNVSRRTRSSDGAGYSRVTRYAASVIPWIVLALVAVPLVVVAFVATRRRTVAGEHPASEDAQARALTEQEFAEAEAYEAKWREEDKEKYHQERLP